ncbi:MAG: hypothetical protein DRP13_01730 [Candidatus Aenigmatarchaeota archaeon]|mgnify:CR=1 FL=1|nr:MAG: hypothetical protein DRP13_01730 [Candidatus Aenigmarchaeota archaeon]
MKMKAQSAMEYLMTYGWAILIVIIVAAALFALGVFNPSTYTGYTATGFATLGAPSEWQYQGNTFTVKLKNQVGQSITISAVNVTNDANNCNNGTSINIASGGTATVVISGCESKSSGDSYSVNLKVSYTVSGGTMTRTETGTLTGIAV